METIEFEWDESCRSGDNVIRIISARKATKNETKTYNHYTGGDNL